MARKMLTTLFAMLSKGKCFNLELYAFAVQSPKVPVDPVKEMERLAKRLGYSVVKDPVPS